MPELFTLAPNTAQLKVTTILDHDHEEVRKLADKLNRSEPGDHSFVRTAHLHLVQRLRPVYSVNEWQSASRTLQEGRGSCSQRMACLEAVARAVAIPTRVRALRVKGSFWYPRFTYVRIFVPESILMVWPQFYLSRAWLDFDELYAPIAQLAAHTEFGFTNNGESLFEAVQHTPIDFCGKTCGMSGAKPEHNLSRFVIRDEGFFDTGDEVFERFGSFQYTLRGRVFQAMFADRRSS